MFLTSNTPRNRCARRTSAGRDFAALVQRVATPVVAWLAFVALIGSESTLAATVETSNFRVTASEARIAEELALTAEELRKQLAREWLGKELPRWSSPCLVVVDTGAERMTGDTTYEFGSGRVRRWRMTLRGPVERIVASLLPHEIAHTVLASHFRRAIPRWADEGVALMAEDELDRRRVRAMADSILESDDRLALHTFLEIDEYPADRRRMRVLYAQSASFTEFLVMAGKRRFLDFVAAGIDDGWVAAAESTYGFSSLAEVEQCWHEWESQQRPRYVVNDSGLLADAARRHSVPESTPARPVTEGPDSPTAASTSVFRRAASMPDPAADAAGR